MYYKMFDVYFQKNIFLGISKILFIFSIIAQVSKVCSNFKMCSHFLEKNVHGFKNVFASVNFCAEFSIYFIELFVKTWKMFDTLNSCTAYKSLDFASLIGQVLHFTSGASRVRSLAGSGLLGHFFTCSST